MATFLRKLIVIGDSAVGKTAVIQKYVNNQFNETMISTTGVDFNNKDLIIDGQKVKIQIWDTAGQEKYRALTSQYYRRAHGIILFYSVTDKTSFQHLQNWLDSIESNTMTKIPVILLANKCDLAEVVPREQAEEFARSKNLSIFFTSAKTGENLDAAFQTIAEMSIHVQIDSKKDVVKLNNKTEEKKDKKKCC